MNRTPTLVNRLLVLLALGGFLPLHRSRAQAPSGVRLAFPSAQISDVLATYQALSGRPVYLAIGVTGQVNVVTEKPVSPQEACDLIRKNLLESCGVEVRDSGQGDILVNWSQDPQYPHRTSEQTAPPSLHPPGATPPASPPRKRPPPARPGPIPTAPPEPVPD